MTFRSHLLIFAIASGLAVATGAAVLALAGSPASTWLRNPIAWAVGALAALGVARLDRPQHSVAFIAVGLAALVGTFAAAPVEGAHRWLDIGPLHINAAALVLPAMLAGLARIEAIPARLAIVAATGVILILQPDASQATAFASGAAVLLLARGAWSLEKLGAALVCATIVIATWLRPESLEPVAEVEGILALAAQVSVILTASAAAAVALASLAPLLARNTAGVAIASYFAVCAVAPLVGAYPVPLVGLGMSFPLGWWLGAAVASCATARRAP